MLALLSVLLAASVSASKVPAIPTCEIRGTIVESKFMEKPPESYSIKLKITSVEDKCQGIFPKDATIPIFIDNKLVRSGDIFSKNMSLSGVATYNKTATLESYQLDTNQKPASETTQAPPQNQAMNLLGQFWNWLKNLFSRVKL